MMEAPLRSNLSFPAAPVPEALLGVATGCDEVNPREVLKTGLGEHEPASVVVVPWFAEDRVYGKMTSCGSCRLVQERAHESGHKFAEIFVRDARTTKWKLPRHGSQHQVPLLEDPFARSSNPTGQHGATQRPRANDSAN